MAYLIRITLLSAVLLLGPVNPEQAQAQFSGLQSEGTNYYTFARAGENTIQLLMIGDTNRDGIYEIGEGTDLAEFIAVSGGVGEGVRSGRERRTVRIRLIRDTQEGRREVVYEADLSDFLMRDTAYPTLESGDIVRVEVERNERLGVREILQVVSTLTTIGLLIERIARRN
jgi:hypothetical protein